MKKYIIFLLLLVNFAASSQTLTLEECINLAIEKNIDIKSAILAHEDARIANKTAKSGRLPSLDANYNIGQNYGRSIDPFTNGYVNQQLTFSNVSLNSSVLLYNGFRVKREIEQSKFGLQAADLERKELEDQLALLVTQAYLDALNVKDILQLSTQRVETTTQSLEQIEKAFAAGSGDPENLYDFRGQLAADQLRVIDAENQLKSMKLVLLQLMNTDYNEQITLENLTQELQLNEYVVAEIFSSAMNNFEAFEARKVRVKEANSALKAENAALMPSVFLFAGANSNYSSAASRLNILDEVVRETGDFVEIDNNQVPVLGRTNNSTRSNIAYGTQLFDNISPNFGISVNYPIFNQHAQRNRISRAKIAVSNAELEDERLAISFRQAIELAVLEYDNAKRRLQLLGDQVTAFEESFRINQVKLDNGVSNQVEYILSFNNLETAKLTLTNARFQLLMQQKLIEFYGS